MNRCDCCWSLNDLRYAQWLQFNPEMICQTCYVNCAHTPWTGPSGNEDWEPGDPEALAYEAVLVAQWEALPMEPP